MRRSVVAALAGTFVVGSALVVVPSRAEIGSAAAPIVASGTQPNTTAVGDTAQVEASFVSALGWVKPGEGYPFRVILRNSGANTLQGVSVTITAPPGAVLIETNDPANVALTPNEIVWTPGDLAAGSAEAPATRTLVIGARSKSLVEEPTIVWQDISSSAALTYTGLVDGPLVSTTHGPKVIPDDPAYDTARFGDRPFPVVPVQYFDREPGPDSTAERLAEKLNDPATPGSTFNLYQELSYGQLFPQASIPSSGIATADFLSYAPGFEFTQIGDDVNTCAGGFTWGNVPDQIGMNPFYDERIVDGWYRLPGNTAYYGADANGTALTGALTGVAALQVIDQGCGDIGKGVFDAAQIADPEIDYDDFDTDKDGVVDFFMMVFTGLGGNGDSQLEGVPPYDNIWPHSSSLELSYRDPVTGLGGYMTDDQLRSLEGVPQCWQTADYLAQDDCAANGGLGDDTLPVFVRVGPYNVNPESAIEKASVISHEYGHSLGLPDFYSTGGRTTYGDFNLMATDKSQGMDVYSRQELGWIVPTPLADGTYADLPESDTDLHRIDWQTPDGTPYTLSGPGVHNGPAWMAKLPPRKIIDADFVDTQASASHVWWSTSGNDFGCTPTGGRNLDIYVPEMATLAEGTATSLDFRSYFDIEWDYDYGFVMVSTDGGETFTSLASENGYTTPAAQNPNANLCQATYGNGVTGTGGAYDGGTAPVDRVLGIYGDPSFVADSYDLTPYAGQEVVIRFSYATDPALARPGWFIDDLSVTAGNQDLFVTQFETEGDPDDPRIFNGGCQEGLGTRCTKGWQFVDTESGSAADHGYYLEMRDRSSFDLQGRDENDRDPIDFDPGLLLVYTDEAHGIGNNGVDDPPAQTPLDSQPEPGEAAPDLSDATFTAAADDSHFDDKAWIDNYEDPRREPTCVADCDNPVLAHVVDPFLFDFDCLSFDVTQMSGQDVGPETSPGNLTGDLDVDVSDGCADFDYGRGGGENRAPTAVAQAKFADAPVGVAVPLDGSRSFDDRDVPGQLTYAWDTDGDGTDDAQGATASATFDDPGSHVVRLTVTDRNGLSDTDEVTILVTEEDPNPPPPPEPEPEPQPQPPPTTRTPVAAGGTTRLPATGAEVPVAAGLGLVVLALALRRLA